MKIPRNQGISESDIVQNRFTAYAQAAVYHYRERYLQRRKKRRQLEVSYEEQEPFLRSLPSDPPEDTSIGFENAALALVWESLREKDRLILIRHTVNGESLKDIADDLQMPYVTVKAIYKRCKENFMRAVKNK